LSVDETGPDRIDNVHEQDFDAFYWSEREKWGKVIKETGMDKD
jgi:hypothetical protein